MSCCGGSRLSDKQVYGEMAAYHDNTCSNGVFSTSSFKCERGNTAPMALLIGLVPGSWQRFNPKAGTRVRFVG